MNQQLFNNETTMNELTALASASFLTRENTNLPTVNLSRRYHSTNAPIALFEADLPHALKI
jgi:hypothetical protein